MAALQPIILTDRQRALLEEIALLTTKSSKLSLRARIILATAQGMSIAQIVQQINVSRSTISHCRQRWRRMAPALDKAEQSGNRQQQFEVIQATLSKLSHERERSVITDEQLAQIVAISREDPRDSGRDIEHWTMATLANEAVKRGIAEQISVNKLSHRLRQIGFRNEVPPPPLHRSRAERRGKWPRSSNS